MKLVPIDSLVPYAKNSRTHPKKQIKAIRRSIEAFGMVGDIVVRGNVIAKGHATLEAIKLIHKDGEPLYPAPGKPGGAEPYPSGLVPMLDVSLWSEEQFRAYVIADNKIPEDAGWDKVLMKEEFESIGDIDLSSLLNEIGIEEFLKKSVLDATYNTEGGGEDYFFEEPKEVELGEEEGLGSEAGLIEGGGGETLPHSLPEEIRENVSSKYPVTFSLEKADYQRWLDAKEKHPSLSFKTVFLRGLKND